MNTDKPIFFLLGFSIASALNALIFKTPLTGITALITSLIAFGLMIYDRKHAPEP